MRPQRAPERLGLLQLPARQGGVLGLWSRFPRREAGKAGSPIVPSAPAGGRHAGTGERALVPGLGLVLRPHLFPVLALAPLCGVALAPGLGLALLPQLSPVLAMWVSALRALTARTRPSDRAVHACRREASRDRKRALVPGLGLVLPPHLFPELARAAPT